jgi:hypothetical protein
MSLLSRHLDADELGAAVWEPPTGRIAAHLAACEGCRREREAVIAALAADRARVHREADDALAPVDLARQRQSIQERVARLGVAARVLPFRGARTAVEPATTRPADQRWVLAAAAAGLALGLAVGHGPWTMPASGSSEPALDSTQVAAVEPLGADAWRDDPLLLDIEAVIARETRPEFEALDELTPLPDEGR